MGEMSMLSEVDYPQEDDGPFSTPPADRSNIAVHVRLCVHTRAITSIFFNLLEDQLISTSIDKSIRFWNVDSGDLLRVFTDSSPVPVTALFPFNPQVFVAANSNAVLRIVNHTNGVILQKLKLETEVRALKFDDSGAFLLAGTKKRKRTRPCDIGLAAPEVQVQVPPRPRWRYMHHLRPCGTR